jgi:3-keto-5-aminohexanoate cleavage enzyme
MFDEKKKKIAVIAAITGETARREGGPNVPVTPEAIAEEAFNCYKAGASVIHIHARDSETELMTHDLAVFADIMKRIREKCDALIQTTGAFGGKVDPVTNIKMPFTDEQRMGLLNLDPKQDAYPIPMSTMDLTGHDGRTNTVYNSTEFLRKVIPAAISKGIAWEMEVWDVHALHRGYQLGQEGVFDINGPIWLNFCMGAHTGAQPATARQVIYIADEGKRLFPQMVWEVDARGPNHWEVMGVGIAAGCDMLRTGFEDHWTLPSGVMARSNVEMVEATVRIIKDLGREVATVADARTLLQMPR